MIDLLTLKPETFSLDISDYSLKFAQLKKARGQFSLSMIGESIIPDGLIEDGEIKKADDLKKMIAEASKVIQGGKLKTKYVIASLPEERAFLQVIQLPRIKREEVFHAIAFEAENYIPYPLETVYLDFQIISQQENADHLDVLIVALPKNIVESYLDVLQGAGLKPRALELESLGISRALIAGEISSVPVLLVDLGASRTSFMVFSGKSLRFTASLPISSRMLCSALAKSLNIHEKKAEIIKNQYGVAAKEGDGLIVQKTLLPIIQELAEQMQKYLGYYESHSSHQH